MRAIDLAGRYVVPGLIDAHVHIAGLPAMRAALESGVTTVRSAGVSHYVDVGLRELVKQGQVAGPDVVAAGYHVRPGVAPELFLDFPDLGDLMGIGVGSADAIRRVVRANLSRGVDWIKTLATERARRGGAGRRAQHRARHLCDGRDAADDGQAGHLLRPHRRHRQRPGRARR
jgi:imidazolonepropionase-like amidohydrolase